MELITSENILLVGSTLLIAGVLIGAYRRIGARSDTPEDAGQATSMISILMLGAVPIIFATYPVVADVEGASQIFNIVFFITILSLLVQGTTVITAARRLGLVEPEKSPRRRYMKYICPITKDYIPLQQSSGRPCGLPI